MSVDALIEFIRKAAGNEGLLSLSAYQEIAAEFSINFRDIERIVLENGFFPLRFQRQRNLLGASGQLSLLNAKVAIVGCGGLGGSIFEMLLRLGVGHLLVIDPDFFCESNLNRQLLATSANLGRYKVDVAFERGQLVNPVAEVETLNQVFQVAAGEVRLASCDLVCDALDSVPARLELAQLCARNQLMLIHGAVAGWTGQVAPVPPGSGRMARIYPVVCTPDSVSVPDAEIEALVENIAPVVNSVAALQVAAAIRYLGGSGVDPGSELRSEKALPGCFIDLAGPELELLD